MFNQEEKIEMEILNRVLQPVLLIVLPVLVVAILIWLAKVWQIKRGELSLQQLTTIRWLVSFGVWAAEQAWQAGDIPKGKREQFVIDFVQAQADKYHVHVDVAQIVVFIKAAVAEEFNKGRIVVPSLPAPTTTLPS